jgi:hypothetical protein
MSGGPVSPKSLIDRLVKLAMSALVIAVAIYFAACLIEAVAGVLIGIAVIALIVYAGWLWREHRRSEW